jgi:transposase
VPMLAELVDAVVGVDTHRDTHEVEIALPTGTPIGTRKISNTSSGFADLLAWIGDRAPGPRVVVSIEGTRSFGVGLARAVTAAGLTVIECEQPNRKARRGKGKSDPIDAHLAVLAALRLNADRLPLPRADGDREALRILLGARHELSVATTAQTNRLRALLLGGEDTERDLARAALTDPVLLALVRRRESRHASREQAVRHGEIRRLALAVRAGRDALAANRAQLQTIVEEMAPGLTDRRGIGAVTAAQAIVSFSHVGRCRNDGAFAALSGTSPLPASSGQTVRHRLNRGGDRALNSAIHTIAITRMRCCPSNQGVCRPTQNRGQVQPGDPAVPQALHRPRALPRTQRQHHPHRPDLDNSGGRLTNIEASEGWGFESLRVRQRFA